MCKTSYVGSDIEFAGCPVCGQAPYRIWKDEGKPTRYVRCCDCRTIYASPRASRVARLRWLEENYGIGERVFKYAATRHRALGSEAAFIRRHVSSGAMLDVGCDTGELFKWFGGTAWQRYGVELISSAAAYAARTYDAQVRAGTLQEASFPDAYFGLVTMMDMFYLVEDPGAILREILRILQPQGLLAIEIPGQIYHVRRSHGLLSLILDGKWSRMQTDSPYLFWVNPAGFQQLLENNGFHVMDWHIVPALEISNRVGRLAWDIYLSILTKLARMDFRALTFVPKYLFLAKPREPSRHSVLNSEIRQPGNVIIQQGTEDQAGVITALHRKYIATSALESVELDFLRSYYDDLLCGGGGVVYVAIASEQVIGYASLVRDQTKHLMPLLLKHPLMLLRMSRMLVLSRSLRLRMGFRFNSELLGGKWGEKLTIRRYRCELRSVAVTEDHRGKGIGRQLLQACCDHARREKWRAMIAWIGEDNVSSQHLFQSAGFRRIGSRIESQGTVHLYLLETVSVEAKEAAIPKLS